MATLDEPRGPDTISDQKIRTYIFLALALLGLLAEVLVYHPLVGTEPFQGG
jgi:hypothetical protein